MVAALVNVDAIQFAIVLKASLTATGGHSLLDDACAVWTAVGAVTRVLADKIDALSVEGTIGVVQTFHSLAPCLVIVSIACEKSSFGTLALHLMTDDAAIGMRSTGIKGTQVDTARNAALVTSAGGIQGTVEITAWALARILASSPTVANFAFSTGTSVTSRDILTNGRRVARFGGAFVYIKATNTGNVIKAGHTGALCIGANLVNATVHF